MLAALLSTMPLLMCMGYFFMGSLPLLVLKHDTPMDARFVRGFFNTYYLAVACAATIPALAYALAGQLAFSLAMVAVAALALLLRKVVLARMDILRPRIEGADATATLEFRRIHMAGMGINMVQLVALVWGLFHVSPK
ncbi:MAG: hypothetical protein WCH44_10590 [Betaproteobacteria bacterium]